MRKLATIRRIDDVLPIEGADAIVLVKIDGWQCVALKTEFSVGDLCVYFEIDSHIPLCPQVEHLKARAYKKMGDKDGIRIKTIKLRGELSQGLALPVNKFFDMFDGSDEDEGQELSEYFFLGNDVSDLIGVEKYEPPVPTELGGQVSGNFPGFVPKTNQERCQNMPYRIFTENADAQYEVSMKLDGTSFTGFHVDGETGVCGRNWELEMNEHTVTNSLIRMFIDSGLQAALGELKANIAVQGELMGPAIQKNREGLKAHKLFIFDMYHISECRYLNPAERHAMLANLYTAGLKRDMVEHVPVLTMGATLAELGIKDVQELLAYSEGPSIAHPIREGLVYKRIDGVFSFKAISNAFLLKEKD